MKISTIWWTVCAIETLLALGAGVAGIYIHISTKDPLSIWCMAVTAFPLALAGICATIASTYQQRESINAQKKNIRAFRQRRKTVQIKR